MIRIYSKIVMMALLFTAQSYADDDLQIVESHRASKCVGKTSPGCAKSRLVLTQQEKINELEEQISVLQTELENKAAFSVPEACRHFNQNGIISFLPDAIKVVFGSNTSYFPYPQVVYITVSSSTIFIHSSVRSREIGFSSFSSVAAANSCIEAISETGLLNR